MIKYFISPKFLCFYKKFKKKLGLYNKALSCVNNFCRCTSANQYWQSSTSSCGLYFRLENKLKHLI